MVRKHLKTLFSKVLVVVMLLLCGNAIAEAQDNGKIFSCRGTYYHNRFENRRTSSGELFSQKLYTAAHKTLPFHTIVKVTNNRTKRHILVKINDRCGRNGIVDLSKAAAQKIGLNGSEQVTIEVLGKDYVDIWNIQNNMLNDGLVADSIRISYVDSLVDERKSNSEYLFFVRLTTVEGEKGINSAKEKLSDKYQALFQVEKIYNEKFYYINIGPFFNENEVDFAVKELKKMYPLAHSIKKKRE